ncbi:MAG: efflux RND transporter periplasmic adaptor subunit [Terriglobia bacterium]|jgi:membrane fusion protein, multidrug efflux system
MRSAALLVSLAIALVCTSCRQDTGGAASAAPQTTPQLEVVAVKSEKLNTTERLPAELVPYERVDVFAKETGFVKSIAVDRGSKVKQGEFIAELEAPELIARQAQADAAYQGAESQLAAGQAKLAADQATYQHMSAAAKVPGVVAANDLEIALRIAQSDEANVAALEKTVQAAQENLRAVTQLQSYLRITAPFDGQVTTRYVHPGALVGPGGGPGVSTPIVQIQTLTRHRLVVPVPETDVAGIPEGTEVSFTVPSYPGKIFKAPIARISRSVDNKTRTMPVELDVRDPQAELDPGTFCEVSWPVRRDYSTLFVPASALANDLERAFVVRVENDRAEWVDVKTGAKSGNLIEVFGNLKRGDQVAVRGTDQIRSGATVTPRLVAAP